MMILDGFGIGGYRSFGSLQRIGPLSKINIFVGQNNAGKSNVLRFLGDRLSQALTLVQGRSGKKLLSGVEEHIGTGEDSFQFSLCIERVAAERVLKAAYPDKWHSSAIKVLEFLSDRTRSTRYIWIDYAYGEDSLFAASEDFVSGLLEGPHPVHDLNEWYARITQMRFNDPHQSLNGILREFTPTLCPPRRAAHMIPAIRKITAHTDAPSLDGTGLIPKLAKLRDPAIEDLQDRNTFHTINRFVASILNVKHVELTIRHDQQELHVKIGTKTWPLDSLGTGVEEAIILATAATTLSNELVCIEEPELHLHPLMQRRLIRYLADETTNQYFIASHSSHILDFPDVNVFHVTQKSDQSHVTLAKTPSQLASVARDLGYRPSDLMQTNCVIWVEGPTDRIYLLHWIASLRDDLVEGLHFSIMFYGGRLLNALSANDPEVDEFISLRRLNRNMVLVMDSDREKKGARLNATKMRVRDEYRGHPELGFAWVTAGREIENYIHPDTIIPALKQILPKGRKASECGRFDRCAEYTRKDGKPGTVDKIKLARLITQYDADLDRYDLKVQITKLVMFIKDANR